MKNNLHSPVGHSLHHFYSRSGRLISSLLGKVLFGTAKALAFVIFILARYLLGYRKAIILKNLTSSFPGKPASEIREMMRDYYRHMSDLVIEPFLFYLAPASLRHKLVTYKNLDLLEGLYRAHKQVIVFASHYGNWEYLINLPEMTDYQVYTAYSPIKNSLLNRMMVGLRSFMGVTLIPRKGFYRQALSLLRQRTEPKMLVIIADQRPAPGSDKFSIPFLDQETAVQMGGERMAAASDAAVVYVGARKCGKFRYEFTFQNMLDADPLVPLSITKAYYQILENNISRAPSYWLWSHNRWKIPGGLQASAL